MISNEKILSVKNLTFSINETVILNGIDLNIERGNIVGFLGGNGSGKTTLLKILAGIIEIQDQKIVLDLKHKKGFIFQLVEQNLIPWKTALENIILPKNGNELELKEKAILLLKELNLLEVLNKYPNQLSGGQKQLISIIRWMVNPTDILFIDEGWSMLDVIQKERIHKLIRKINTDNNTTIILVSHNIEDISMLCNTCYMLSRKPSNIVAELNLTNDFSNNSKQIWANIQQIS